MKNLILRIVPFILIITIICIILGYFDVKFSTEIDYIITIFCSSSFSVCIPLVVFCYLSKKSEILSNVGIGMVFLLIILSIVSYVLLKNLSELKAMEHILTLTKINSSLGYLIAFLQYTAILLLIGADDEKAKLARCFAILFAFLYEMLFVISVWKSFGINSTFYNIRSLLNYLFQFSAIVFIIFKFFGEQIDEGITFSSPIVNSENIEQNISTTLKSGVNTVNMDNIGNNVNNTIGNVNSQANNSSVVVQNSVVSQQTVNVPQTTVSQTSLPQTEPVSSGNDSILDSFNVLPNENTVVNVPLQNSGSVATNNK